MLITAGPTYEKIDPVRFIGNFSSGKMGYALANEAARRGARVTLVSGPTDRLPLDGTVRRVEVTSAREMLSEAQKAWETADIAILAAAVADYRPARELAHKIKRETDCVESLELVQNPDIAATLGASKRPGQQLVGFALETDRPLEHAADKLRRKRLDMIVTNSLADEGAGFAVDTNKISLLFADGRDRLDFPVKAKTDVAADIIDNILTL